MTKVLRYKFSKFVTQIMEIARICCFLSSNQDAKFFQIFTPEKRFKNRQHHGKSFFNTFHMNGHTLGFDQ